MHSRANTADELKNKTAVLVKTHMNEALSSPACTGFVFNEKIFIICIVGV